MLMLMLMLLFLVRRILVGIPGEALTIDNELDGVSWLNIIINKFEREREREREREKERKKERKKGKKERKIERCVFSDYQCLETRSSSSFSSFQCVSVLLFECILRTG